jgi:dihydrolipoamide dehydrogenase
MGSENTLKTEVAVIGAGPGGYVAAIRLAQLNKKVCLIEKEERLGGICLNYGCIPSKAMISASDFFNNIKKASSMGISVKSASIDFQKMQQWKDNLILKLNNGIKTLCKGNKITVIKGIASFESSTRLKITNNKETSYIDFEKVIIATGSKPIELPNLKYDYKKIISSTEALSLNKLPNNLVVVGGGYIGLELGTVYAKLGSKVSVIELANQILPGLNKTISTIVHKKLEKLGVNIYLNSEANKFENNKVTATSKDKGNLSINADKVLVVVGRHPNTKNLSLENANIEVDKKGFLKVDNNLMTPNKNVYAIGDISVGPMLAHKASYQGKSVAEIIAGNIKTYEDSLVPSVIFTDPEIATVGLSEQQAKDQNIKVKVGKFPFSASSRAMTKLETDGFVKIVANIKDNKILGVEIVGSEASNLISEAALAIKTGTTLEDLASTIHPHPTLSENLAEAAEATMGKAIHILNPKI